MDERHRLMMDDIQVTIITKAVIHCWVSGWYRALLISLSLGGCRCSWVDEYSSRTLINDEGRQCWEAHNSVDCSTVVFASFSSTLVQYVFSRLLPWCPPFSLHTSGLLPCSLLPLYFIPDILPCTCAYEENIYRTFWWNTAITYLYLHISSV